MQIIEGEIIQEPEMKYTKDGTPILRIIIKDDYDDVNQVVVFGELAEEYQENLEHGDYILVKGYKNKEYENFVAQSIKRI